MFANLWIKQDLVLLSRWLKQDNVFLGLWMEHNISISVSYPYFAGGLVAPLVISLLLPFSGLSTSGVVKTVGTLSTFHLVKRTFSLEFV